MYALLASSNRIRAAALALLTLSLGCDEGVDERGDATADDSVACSGKCDLPSEASETNCGKRRGEALDSSRRAFTDTAVRWPCADVEGVTTVGADDRGQEYCEYYAIFAPPIEGFEPTALGRRHSAKRDDVGPQAICLEGESGDDCGVTLDEDTLFALEESPDRVVGSCIFTSWHSDVPGPLASCNDQGCPTVHGIEMNEEYGRMKLETNSNATASDVVQFCVDAAKKGLALPEDFSGAEDDPFADPFFRGCQLTALFGLDWRRSDPAICAAVNRSVECGCALPGVETEAIGRAVVPSPSEARGFALGSWRGLDALPAGCEWVDSGEDEQTIVRCDLLAADVVSSMGDPKGACREIYGHQIVAYAPVPTERLECSADTDAVGDLCGTQPWNIGDEH